MKNSTIFYIAAITLLVTILSTFTIQSYTESYSKEKTQLQKVKQQIHQFEYGAPIEQCKNLLPYNLNNHPQNDYLNWYGKVGKSINGTTYEPGHAFTLHIAVNGACTVEQRQANKTVFYNITEFIRILAQIPLQCDVQNRNLFNFDLDGKIASASQYITGIDCSTQKVMKFDSYFSQFKRTINKAKPTQTQYINSNLVTIWTLYPKRSNIQQSQQVLSFQDLSY